MLTDDQRNELRGEMLEAYENVYDAEMTYDSGWTDNRPNAMMAALKVAEASLLPYGKPEPKVPSSDSVAAQMAFGALSCLWSMLGARNQADAVSKLKQWTSLSKASADVFNERARQQAGEAFDASWDDRHNTSCELIEAAICYADNITGPTAHKPVRWPWNIDWWKPTTRRGNLVKAAALLIAEIERLDRAEASK